MTVKTFGMIEIDPPKNEVTQPRTRLLWLLKGALILSAATLLTLLTQAGGVILLFSVLLTRFTPTRFGYRKSMTAGIFVVLYLLASFVLVPKTASSLGRVALPCFDTTDVRLAAQTPLTCLLNRHYVTPSTASALYALARDLQATHPGTSVRYLDAAFPFDLGMPLLPHLSHGDGRKVDLAFFYMQDDLGYQAGLAPSPIGYWGFEQPHVGSSQPCQQSSFLTLRWNMTWLQPLWTDAQLDQERTRAMLQWLVGPGRHHIEKVLLEPHLETRLGFDSDLIRFQGCRAARHDDHLHVTFTN